MAGAGKPVVAPAGHPCAAHWSTCDWCRLCRRGIPCCQKGAGVAAQTTSAITDALRADVVRGRHVHPRDAGVDAEDDHPVAPRCPAASKRAERGGSGSRPERTTSAKKVVGSVMKPEVELPPISANELLKLINLAQPVRRKEVP